jgi:hypothetical protein
MAPLHVPGVNQTDPCLRVERAERIKDGKPDYGTSMWDPGFEPGHTGDTPRVSYPATHAREQYAESYTWFVLTPRSLQFQYSDEQNR